MQTTKLAILLMAVAMLAPAAQAGDGTEEGAADGGTGAAGTPLPACEVVEVAAYYPYIVVHKECMDARVRTELPEL